MATRRSSARLVEGRVYTTPLPRSTMTFGRAIPLVGPQLEQEFVVQGGMPVPTGEPRRAAKQKPMVGSIVQVKATRRGTVRPSTAPTDPVVHPGASPSSPSIYITQTGRITSYMPYVVRAVSECGKFVRIVPLVTLGGYHVSLHPNSDTGGYALYAQNQYYNDPATGERKYGTPPITVDLVKTALNRSWTDFNADAMDPHYGTLVRTTALTKYYDPTDIPRELYAAVRSRMRASAAVAMFDKLARMEDLARGSYNPLRGTRPWARLSGKRNRAHVNETVKSHLATARLHLAVMANPTEDDDPDECKAAALRCLNSAYRAIEDLYTRTYGVPFNPAGAQRMVENFCREHGLPPMRRAECGHFHEGESVRMLMSSYGSTQLVCPQCASSGRMAINSDGEEVLVSTGVSTYRWSDDTVRIHPEPGIIGRRHSGKGVVGFVQPLSGAARGSYITLGMELEMQSVESGMRETMARKLKNKVQAANLLDDRALRKYLHFEEDGSTGPGGFEMVTGYTDLATHAKLLKAMLTDNGAPAWQGKLRSHDAKGGSCGIHVHVQKPTSLIHASKIRYFINAASSEQLVRDVARRYNDSYAQINNGITRTSPEKAAADLVKQVKGSSERRTVPAHATMAMQRINERTRYEALNFQNANTVEFRIFRGTLLYGSVMACLEFTHAVWHFCRFSPATQLTTDKFLEWINHPDNRADTRNLRTYLKRKGWDCYVPNENKKTPPTVPQQPEPTPQPTPEPVTEPTVASTDPTEPTVTPEDIDHLFDATFPRHDPFAPVPIPHPSWFTTGVNVSAA